jgi:hypothetical protein
MRYQSFIDRSPKMVTIMVNYNSDISYFEVDFININWQFMI